MLADVKKTCKRIVGASDDEVPVVTPRDWAQGSTQNPVQRVRRPLLIVMLIPMLTLFYADCGLHFRSLPCIRLDYPLQCVSHIVLYTFWRRLTSSDRTE